MRKVRHADAEVTCGSAVRSRRVRGAYEISRVSSPAVKGVIHHGSEKESSQEEGHEEESHSQEGHEEGHEEGPTQEGCKEEGY